MQNTATHIFALDAKNKWVPYSAMTKRKQITLNEWCEASGLHYTELADRFGISVSQFYRILQGKPTRLQTAKRIEVQTSGKVSAASLMGLDA
jgi:predicted transcriptional regulator